jgi:hypothetical protein
LTEHEIEHAPRPSPSRFNPERSGLALDAASAANILVVNADGSGEGLNDPTPAAPVGGNPGTTIGQQRLVVLQQAAEIGDVTSAGEKASWTGLVPGARKFFRLHVLP